jgi:hypothetical protein
MRSLTLVGLALLVTLTASCGTSGASGRRSTRDARVLLAEEIRGTSASNLLDAIRARRPEWLIKRGQNSVNFEGDIVVYVDNVALGGPDALRSIDVQSIQMVRFMTASEAQLRYGVGHTHGAIVVTTRTS